MRLADPSPMLATQEPHEPMLARPAISAAKAATVKTAEMAEMAFSEAVDRNSEAVDLELPEIRRSHPVPRASGVRHRLEVRPRQVASLVQTVVVVPNPREARPSLPAEYHLRTAANHPPLVRRELLLPVRRPELDLVGSPPIRMGTAANVKCFFAMKVPKSLR